MPLACNVHPSGWAGGRPVSIEAINWALTLAPIPCGRRDASSLAIVLIGLANHAGPDGTNAFPSIGTLSQYCRLSERSVQYALRGLEELGLICPSDPDIVAAYIKRADRRPKGWNLAIHKGAQTLHPAGPDGVQTVPPHGVHTLHPNHPLTVLEPKTGFRPCADSATDAMANRSPRASCGSTGTANCGSCAHAVIRMPAPPGRRPLPDGATSRTYLPRRLSHHNLLTSQNIRE